MKTDVSISVHIHLHKAVSNMVTVSNIYVSKKKNRYFRHYSFLSKLECIVTSSPNENRWRVGDHVEKCGSCIAVYSRQIKRAKCKRYVKERSGKNAILAKNWIIRNCATLTENI